MQSHFFESLLQFFHFTSILLEILIFFLLLRPFLNVMFNCNYLISTYCVFTSICRIFLKFKWLWVFMEHPIRSLLGLTLQCQRWISVFRYKISKYQYYQNNILYKIVKFQAFQAYLLLPLPLYLQLHYTWLLFDQTLHIVIWFLITYVLDFSLAFLLLTFYLFVLRSFPVAIPFQLSLEILMHSLCSLLCFRTIYASFAIVFVFLARVVEITAWFHCPSQLHFSL